MKKYSMNRKKKKVVEMDGGSDVISIRLPTTVIKIIDEVAVREQRSRNNTIRFLLGMGIGSYEVGRVTELVRKPEAPPVTVNGTNGNVNDKQPA